MSGISVNVLVSFNSTNGSSPSAGLIEDANGNLFGTTYDGGASNDGTVFEIAYNASTGYAATPTTLVSFSGANGKNPSCALLADANGNLFGTTYYGGANGGANGYGTVFEITYNASSGYAGTPTTLVSFNSTDGSAPVAGLVADSAGDLFGTTQTGGLSYGTVFEIVNTSGSYASTPITLVKFDSNNGYYPQGSLFIDANGNLIGTSLIAGASNKGLVFEIAKTSTGYATTPTTLVSFNGTDGANPMSSLIADSAGDLFGTTSSGGANNSGAVFEIAYNASTGYASTATLLASLSSGAGYQPYGSLLADANGDLFGTARYTNNPSPYGYGVVFEIVKTSGTYASTPTVLVTFNGTNGTKPQGYLMQAADGNLVGTTKQGGAAGFGTVFELTGSDYQAPCFVTGTRIATARGNLLVEELRINDLIETPANGFQPVSWIGYRGVDCRRHPTPEKIWPVRVAAGAFGSGLPHRDLWLSPDHAVFIDGVLIPIRYLINDATIAAVPMDTVTYWHVELPRHDILLAEGLRCESYLDTGNRAAFTNGSGPTSLHPDFALRVWEAASCARLVLDGPELVAARSFLLEQAELLGHALTADPALHLRVDGAVLQPAVRGQTRIFHLPATAKAVTLVSRRSVPAHIREDADDYRSLGVAVSALRLDGAAVPLTDRRLGSGWHDAEHGEPDRIWRWTDGHAELLLSGGQRLEIDLAMTERYWLRAAVAQAEAA